MKIEQLMVAPPERAKRTEAACVGIGPTRVADENWRRAVFARRCGWRKRETGGLEIGQSARASGVPFVSGTMMEHSRHFVTETRFWPREWNYASGSVRDADCSSGCAVGVTEDTGIARTAAGRRPGDNSGVRRDAVIDRPSMADEMPHAGSQSVGLVGERKSRINLQRELMAAYLPARFRSHRMYRCLA